VSTGFASIILKMLICG